MSEVQRYYAVKYGLVEGESLVRLSVVLAADFDRVTAERDALQALLTAADERADVLTKALTDVREALGREYWDQYAGLDETRDILDAALKPAEGGGDD